MTPEVELGTGIALIRSEPKPAHRFGIVLENARAVGVHETEVELGAGVTLARSRALHLGNQVLQLRVAQALVWNSDRLMHLLGSQPVPAHSFGMVLRYAPAVVVHDTKFVLGRSVALLSVNEEPSHRCGIVATVIRCHSFVKRLPRRDWRAGQRSQQRQGDNAAPNQPVFNACL